jgi:hypothetical protein
VGFFGGVKVIVCLQVTLRGKLARGLSKVEAVADAASSFSECMKN